MRLAALGKRLGELDERYAEKVRDLVMTEPDGSKLTTLRNTLGVFAGSPVGYAAPDIKMEDARKILEMGIPMGAAERVLGSVPAAAGITARYVVPGAMITAAGAGLADLTQNFYDSMSNTPVLPS